MDRFLALLVQTCFRVKQALFNPTHLAVLQRVEAALMLVPGIGQLFSRRILILALKP